MEPLKHPIAKSMIYIFLIPSRLLILLIIIKVSSLLIVLATGLKGMMSISFISHCYIYELLWESHIS
jgi:hypothetical protein